jgi:transcriptional regulator with PAS, ATPase and Fis domain
VQTLVPEIIGQAPAMQEVFRAIGRLSRSNATVLINGASGTGKELVAHALHRMSPRRDGPLVAVNAAALPASLVEAELFGYEAGSFTGADRKGRKGKFEQAAGGTIFLDEIGDMPTEVQAKLLRVLQDRMIERVGGERPREVDFRFVSATNSDLSGQVDKGRFRLDLYYRISPIVIEVPPLRDRREDIPELASHFAAEVAHRHARPALPIGQQAMHWLMSQGWPGNVRQLRHEIERAFVFAEGEAIEVRDFQHGRADDRELAMTAGAEMTASEAPRRTSSLRSAIGHVEDQAIRAAMERHKGNKKRVAAELGISRSYLYKKLSELSL